LFIYFFYHVYVSISHGDQKENQHSSSSVILEMYNKCMIFIHVCLRTNYENYDFLTTPYVNYVTRITNLERMEV